MNVSFNVNAKPVAMLNTRPDTTAAGCLGREQIGFYDIIDVREVPCLLAVSEDHRLLAMQHLRDELSAYGRIL